ncbi:Dabb family protein [Cyclobacterium sp. 1_MG-2023]|uniref:Dabb family protein n=1 Tax=Cyclobacterium sp. 1_MG-2023 TaxID=3062681 RepID=UPI0026E23D04|nr:Dabb family protein [Cyclobacterium sp. 1_MG-2023]MDO6438918.1 Dabb family protein [Cyclobacterium sp. 1_MG-2023]
MMTRHFGMFKFKETVSAEEIEFCFVTMKAMIGKIPGLLGMEYGAYDSGEGLNDGFTHGFIMTFESPESRDAYLPHPVHEEVKNVVVPNLERVVVFDFNV